MYTKLKQIARKMYSACKTNFAETSTEEQRVALINKVIADLKVVQLKFDSDQAIKKLQLEQDRAV